MPSVQRKGQSLVEQLVVAVPKREVNNIVPLRNYYRSLDLVLSQATAYRVAHNEEQLYVMLMRYASLLIETIPKHKDYAGSANEYMRHKKHLLQSVLPELERLKLSLNTKARPAQLVARSLSTSRPAGAQQLTVSNLPQLNWADSAPQLPAAADVHAARSSSSSQASTSYSSYQLAYAPSSQQALQKHALLPVASSTAALPPPAQLLRPRYPQFDKSPTSPIDLLWQPPAPPQVEPSAPALPDLATLAVGRAQAGPLLGPQEVAVIGTHASSVPPGSTCSAPPPGDPSLALVAADAAAGGARPIPKRADLRDVFISRALLDDFMHYAASNTRRGIESCGILAGTLSGNDSVFNVSTLIVPKQEGTSDTVSALCEEEIYEVQASRELYPLGWIHTHPTQTCFLSSVDIHTHCGYQTMLEESIAIVMAPTDRNKKFAVFRLTTPGGLSLIQKCPLRGFHAHPPTDTGQDIYELCGHVYLNERLRHDVVDLR